jgi:cobalt-zinc-cadmium efflux system membrane fusion protein
MNTNITMRQRIFGHLTLLTLVTATMIGVGYYVYRQWQNQQAETNHHEDHDPGFANDTGTMPARVNAEARKNLGVRVQALEPQSYFRQIEVPGTVVDRPGVSDRGVTAPIAGVVSRIHAFPGSTVAPQAPLFTLRLVSDAIHTSQLELFKATKDIEIARQQRQRLEGLAASGGVAGVRMIELENEIQRFEVTAHGIRQNLLARGLSAEQITAASQGNFVTEITVSAPGEPELLGPTNASPPENLGSTPNFVYEVHTLHVDLGQQVEAGTNLSVLADHRALMIEGRGFRKDLSAIQQAATLSLPIEVSFESGNEDNWPAIDQSFQLEHITNSIDPTSRTFGFYLPLINQWRRINQDDSARLIWRFRPGDRVRIFVGVERLENVFVLPTAAVVREAGEAFVFRQNGDLFDRISVQVLHEDSRHVIIANDGKLKRHSYIAQNVAASLNRILKAQLASGTPSNMHVHADGTVHAAH